MKKIIAVLLLVASTNSLAKNGAPFWYPVVTDSGGTTAYVDIANARTFGSKHKIWLLVNFATPHISNLPNKVEYFSELFRQDYYCEQDIWIDTEVYQYTSQNANGVLVNSEIIPLIRQKAERASPHSAEERIINYVCSLN
jgi:hypothetical protein